MRLNELRPLCALKAQAGEYLTLDAPGLAHAISLEVPVLASTGSLAFPRAFAGVSPHIEGGFTLLEQGEWCLGVASVDCGDAEETALASYGHLLERCNGWRLCRLWNFLPGINECSNGMETYKAFCAGRSRAFEHTFGPQKEAHMPAASCVGSKGSKLGIVFLATRSNTEHIENPLQVPAYAYPPEYGPRPPSFARATLVRGGSGPQAAFVSGTAAIRGHASQAGHDLSKQVDITVQNIRQLLGELQARGFDLHTARRYVQVYLRKREDLDAVTLRLQDSLLRQGDSAIYVEAAICRRELDVEIEMTLSTHGEGI